MLKVCYVEVDLSGLSSKERIGDKQYSQLGHKLLKYGLAHFFGLREQDYFLIKNEHGKPYLLNNDRCFFNISHSGEYVVCAFSDTPVGIDIERIKKMPEGIAKRFFHPAETAELEQLPDIQKRNRFFTYWSVKESYLKYLGDGLNRGLSSFEVRLEEEINLYENNQRLPLFVRECRINPDYTCYVCSKKNEVPEILHFSHNLLVD